MNNIFLENVIKNIVVILILVLAYFQVQVFFLNLNLDKLTAGSMLIAVSILAVTACFGNFAFTYEKVDKSKFDSRLLAHLTTGLPMLLIGLSLEMTSALSRLLIGDFIVFNLSLVLLYISSVLYDFWDLKRTNLISK